MLLQPSCSFHVLHSLLSDFFAISLIVSSFDNTKKKKYWQDQKSNRISRGHEREKTQFRPFFISHSRPRRLLTLILNLHSNFFKYFICLGGSSKRFEWDRRETGRKRRQKSERESKKEKKVDQEERIGLSNENVEKHAKMRKNISGLFNL